ncbi:DUF4281 domain-containing protein [Roseovarius faecimaris]|uniref:DUF4281 domain-containing protein n=1 Tax=Roseovarius faecimaris TaxID=2494550 RepID=A0A6I6IPI5_9RHOB|nr:ABA4-like family protein [Roseovarius faecimaris]QGX98615.1 DUF4281 domain-containing protein [Roseovarius faecimaris]
MPLPEILFYAIHLPLLPAWALLFFAPEARITRLYVHSGAVPLILGLVYAGFLIAGVFFGQSHPDAGMHNLPSVTNLFSHPVGVLTGWSHFIVFDLFVGAWIARDAREQGLGHLGTLPCLFFALLFGPLGLLLHILRRLALGRGMML